MPTLKILADWIAYLIGLIGTIHDLFSGQTTEQKVEMCLQALYDLQKDMFYVRSSVQGSLWDEPFVTTTLNDIKGTTVGVASTLQLAHDYAEANASALTDVQSILDAIWARVAPGEDPPPIASTADTARILAALYYVANAVVVPAWSLDNTEVLDAISALDNVVDSGISAIATNDNANTSGMTDKLNALLGYGEAVNLDTDAIIDTLAEGLTGGPSGPGGYPGLAGVTVGATHNVSGPTTISGPLDGLLITVSSVPNGQSTTFTPNGVRYKGLGWVVFMTAEGEGEQLQKIETAKCVLVPKSMSAPASAEVYCKPGTAMSVKPFTLNA